LRDPGAEPAVRPLAAVFLQQGCGLGDQLFFLRFRQGALPLRIAAANPNTAIRIVFGLLMHWVYTSRDGTFFSPISL